MLQVVPACRFCGDKLKHGRSFAWGHDAWPVSGGQEALDRTGWAS